MAVGWGWEELQVRDTAGHRSPEQGGLCGGCSCPRREPKRCLNAHSSPGRRPPLQLRDQRGLASFCPAPQIPSLHPDPCWGSRGGARRGWGGGGAGKPQPEAGWALGCQVQGPLPVGGARSASPGRDSALPWRLGRVREKHWAAGSPEAAPCALGTATPAPGSHVFLSHHPCCPDGLGLTGGAEFQWGSARHSAHRAPVMPRTPGLTRPGPGQP